MAVAVVWMRLEVEVDSKNIPSLLEMLPVGTPEARWMIKHELERHGGARD